MSSVYSILSWLVNHGMAHWEGSEPIPILQMRQLKPFPTFSWMEHSTSEDEDHVLRKGLGPLRLLWAVLSALGCLPLDFVLHERNNQLLGLVAIAGFLSHAAQHFPNWYSCVLSFVYPLTIYWFWSCAHNVQIMHIRIIISIYRTLTMDNACVMTFPCLLI